VGRTFTTPIVTNTPDPVLYQTNRYGTFSYVFPVSNGSYIVTLKFAENVTGNGVGSRIFNVSINGTAVLTNFDIAAVAMAAGGPVYRAVDEVFPVTATGGKITISWTPGPSGTPTIKALSVTQPLHLVTFNWTPGPVNSTNPAAICFNVWKAPSATCTYTQIASQVAPPYIDSAVSSGQVPCYKVAGANAQGVSLFTAPVCATIP
jgi:hypothetical protein